MRCRLCHHQVPQSDEALQHSTSEYDEHNDGHDGGDGGGGEQDRTRRSSGKLATCFVHYSFFLFLFLSPSYTNLPKTPAHFILSSSPFSAQIVQFSLQKGEGIHQHTSTLNTQQTDKILYIFSFIHILSQFFLLPHFFVVDNTAIFIIIYYLTILSHICIYFSFFSLRSELFSYGDHHFTINENEIKKNVKFHPTVLTIRPIISSLTSHSAIIFLAWSLWQSRIKACLALPSASP